MNRPRDSTHFIAETQTNQQQNPFESPEQTTTFLSDLPVVDSDTITEVPIIRPYQEDRIHTITDVMERPYAIDDFDWTSTEDHDTIIATIDPIAKLLAQDNFAKKLYNYKYFHFGVVLRFMACFQRFQCGKLLISAIPYRFDTKGRSGTPGWTAQMSTAHHVELDAGSREEVELTLPFLYDRPAWDTKQAEPQFQWRVFVSVMNPLTGTTNNETVNIQVFATAQNVELTLPIAQSNTESIRKSKAGIISSTAGVVESVSSALTKVPMLSSIAGPVSWVAKGVGALASAFGFSKPLNVTTLQRVANVPGYGFTNVDGEDHSVKMALTLSNEVAQLPEEDDMEIHAITRRQGWIGRGSWAASDAVGTNLFSVLVGPYQVVNEVHMNATPPLIIEHSPPVTFAARMFQFWRGSMTFRISFAKNQFYSGKLVVSFQPTDAEPTFAQTNNLYRQVISVKDSNDFLFTVPYISNRDFLGINEAIGTLTFTVMNRLQAAETVADSIEFNIWCSSHDIEFAVPAENLPATYRSVFSVPPAARDYPRAQTGLVPGVAETDVAPEVHMFQTRALSVRPTTTIGEEITNLRPLIRRFAEHGSFTTSTSVNNFPPAVSEIGLNIFDVTVNFEQTHALRYMVPAFLFFRGGMRYKAIAPAASILAVEQGKSNIGALNIPGAYNGLMHMVAPRINPMLEFELPFYCQSDRRYLGNSATMSRNGVFDATVVTYDDTLGVTNSVRSVLIAGADDSTFSVFVFSPPFVRPFPPTK